MKKPWQNPFSPYPLIGTPYVMAKTQDRDVYLIGVGMDHADIIYPGKLQDAPVKGEPPLLVIRCPRCGEGLLVGRSDTAHQQKTVRVEYLDEPQHIQTDVGVAVQTAVVSVDEPLECPYPKDGAVCGCRFAIKENRLSRVGSGRR